MSVSDGLHSMGTLFDKEPRQNDNEETRKMKEMSPKASNISVSTFL